jgi:aarF domain-containing kinase
VIWAKHRILVMEFIPGKRLDDLAYLDASSISRDEVSAGLARIFNEMIFGHNAPLHCDPHGGNLAIRLNKSRGKPYNFDIILYDHGLYRDIPDDMRRSYAKLWLAVIDTNIPNMKRYAREVAGVTAEQFPLFASAITGRDYGALTKGLTTQRDKDEKEIISEAMTEGLLAQLIQLLANVPPIILLILKTNDLTRSLEENLQTGRGPERTFLIMARYCTRTVYEEALEGIMNTGGMLRLGNLARWVGALWSYWRVEVKLRIFEGAIFWGEMLRLRTKPTIATS